MDGSDDDPRRGKGVNYRASGLTILYLHCMWLVWSMEPRPARVLRTCYSKVCTQSSVEWTSVIGHVIAHRRLISEDGAPAHRAGAGSRLIGIQMACGARPAPRPVQIVYIAP